MNETTYFPNLDERTQIQLIDGILARTFWGEQMLMAVVDLEPNAYLPRHDHVHEQVGVVIEGELTLTIGDETRTVKPGEIYIIPGGTEHEARTGDQPAKVMDVFSPVREEYKFPN